MNPSFSSIDFVIHIKCFRTIKNFPIVFETKASDWKDGIGSKKSLNALIGTSPEIIYRPATFFSEIDSRLTFLRIQVLS